MTAVPEHLPTPKSEKQAIWLAEYLKVFNASEAARRAGYRTRHAAIGAALKADFKDRIDWELRQRVMSKDEALDKLSDIARIDFSQYIEANGVIDVNRLIADGLGHLIKSIKRVRTANDNRLEVEFHDKQGAITTLLRHYTGGTGSAEDPIHLRLTDDRQRIMEDIADKAGGFVAGQPPQLPSQSDD